MILDSNRNALLALDLQVCRRCPAYYSMLFILPYSQVSIATLGVGSGALVAGVFGMNVGDTHRYPDSR